MCEDSDIVTAVNAFDSSIKDLIGEFKERPLNKKEVTKRLRELYQDKLMSHFFQKKTTVTLPGGVNIDTLPKELPPLTLQAFDSFILNTVWDNWLVQTFA